MPPLAFAADSAALEAELLYRTAHGSAADVTTLVAHTKNPNALNAQGQPLLYIAALRTDSAALGIVQALVESGADVNASGGAKHVPLIAAIESGNAQMVSYLLEKGADYRAADANGITAAEHAKQSLSPEVSDVIAQRIASDQAAYALLSSPQGRLKLRYDLAYHACALQYYTFYYRSGQDPIGEAVQTQTLKPHQQGVSTAMGHLSQLFKTSPEMLKAYFAEGKKVVFDEMEQMISNRARRQQGIGQAGDMEKRCDPIAQRLSRTEPRAK